MRKALISVLARIAKYEWHPTEKLWKRSSVAGASIGSTGAMVLLGKLFGISVVAHSSGGLILTGSAGYIAGTLISWVLIWWIFPIVLIIGIFALFGRSIVKLFIGGFDWFIKKLYFWRNPQ